MGDLVWIVLIIALGALMVGSLLATGRVDRAPDGTVTVAPPVRRMVALLALGLLLLLILALIALLSVAGSAPWWVGAALGAISLYGPYLMLTAVCERIRSRVVLTTTTLTVTPALRAPTTLELRSVLDARVETQHDASSTSSSGTWIGWRVTGRDVSGAPASVLVPRWVPRSAVPWLPAGSGR